MDSDPNIWYQSPSIHMGEVVLPAVQNCISSMAVFQQTMNDFHNNFMAEIRRFQEYRSKFPTAATPTYNGPWYAPADLTLPSPWRGLIDGSSGSLYYWNPETHQTQYERPCQQAPQYPPTFTSSDYSVHLNPQPYASDNYHGINLPFTHPYNVASIYPNPHHQSHNPPVNDPHSDHIESFISHHHSPYKATIISQSPLSSTYDSVFSSSPTTKKLKSIRVKLNLRTRSHIQMKRKPLSKLARLSQTRIQGDSEADRCRPPLITSAEPNDLNVSVETSPAFIPLLMVAIVMKKQDFSVPLIKGDSILDESKKLLVPGAVDLATIVLSKGNGSYHESDSGYQPHSPTSDETESSKGRELALDGLWDASGGLPTMKIKFNSLCNSGLVLGDSKLIHDKDHMLEDHKHSAIMIDSPQLLWNEENFSQVTILNPRLEATLLNRNLVESFATLAVSMLDFSTHASKHKTFDFEQFILYHFGISELMATLEVANLQTSLPNWKVRLKISTSNHKGYFEYDLHITNLIESLRINAQNLFVHMHGEQIETKSSALHCFGFINSIINVGTETTVPSFSHAWDFQIHHLGSPLPTFGHFEVINFANGLLASQSYFLIGAIGSETTVIAFVGESCNQILQPQICISIFAPDSTKLSPFMLVILDIELHNQESLSRPLFGAISLICSSLDSDDFRSAMFNFIHHWLCLVLVHTFPLSDALLNHVIVALGLHEWFSEAIEIGNPYALLLALKMGEKVYVASARFGKLLSDPFIPSKLFFADHLSSLANSLTEAIFCQPHIPNVWPVQLNILLSDRFLHDEDALTISNSLKKHKKNPKSSSSDEGIARNFECVCEVFIAGSHLPSSHDCKHLSFDVLLLLLPRLSASYISIFLSYKVVQCITAAIAFAMILVSVVFLTAVYVCYKLRDCCCTEKDLKSTKNGCSGSLFQKDIGKILHVASLMMARDIASRELDSPHVAHVINFAYPKSIDDYVHRIARTGMVVELMKESEQEIPNWLSDYAEKSLSYGGDQSQRYGSSNLGGYKFYGSNNYYGSGNYGCGDSSVGVAVAFYCDTSYNGGESDDPVHVRSNEALLLILLSAIMHSQTMEFVILSNLLQSPNREAWRVFSNMQNSYHRQSSSTCHASVHLCALLHTWQVITDDGYLLLDYKLGCDLRTMDNESELVMYTSLDWNTRFSIALGTAKWLDYLHEECEEKIFHCDIKPEYVLAENEMKIVHVRSVGTQSCFYLQGDFVSFYISASISIINEGYLKFGTHLQYANSYSTLRQCNPCSSFKISEFVRQAILYNKLPLLAAATHALFTRKKLMLTGYHYNNTLGHHADTGAIITCIYSFLYQGMRTCLLLGGQDC